jgi:hypothetical protein
MRRGNRYDLEKDFFTKLAIITNTETVAIAKDVYKVIGTRKERPRANPRSYFPKLSALIPQKLRKNTPETIIVRPHHIISRILFMFPFYHSNIRTCPLCLYSNTWGVILRSYSCAGCRNRTGDFCLEGKCYTT